MVKITQRADPMCRPSLGPSYPPCGPKPTPVATKASSMGAATEVNNHDPIIRPGRHIDTGKTLNGLYNLLGFAAKAAEDQARRSARERQKEGEGERSLMLREADTWVPPDDS